MDRNKCDDCELTFTDDKCLKSHNETEQILNNIDRKKEGNLRLKFYKDDECKPGHACVGPTPRTREADGILNPRTHLLDKLCVG